MSWAFQWAGKEENKNEAQNWGREEIKKQKLLCETKAKTKEHTHNNNSSNLAPVGAGMVGSLTESWAQQVVSGLWAAGIRAFLDLSNLNCFVVIYSSVGWEHTPIPTWGRIHFLSVCVLTLYSLIFIVFSCFCIAGSNPCDFTFVCFLPIIQRIFFLYLVNFARGVRITFEFFPALKFYVTKF